MKIEVGKTYKMRNGTTVLITGKSKNELLEFTGRISGEPFDDEFTESGTFLLYGQHHPFDIIEEITPTPTNPY